MKLFCTRHTKAPAPVVDSGALLRSGHCDLSKPQEERYTCPLEADRDPFRSYFILHTVYIFIVLYKT